MCGIVGAFGKFDESLPSELFLHTIKHRGPDDEGTWKSENIFMGHVRLSILDTSMMGHQPMKSEDGRYVLIYNGEIYNHNYIRAELSELGYVFKSTSDTETLLFSLMHWGTDVLKRLNGIFAFAFYDSLRGELLMARDQFGVKPLYYTLNKKFIGFSSEAKSLLPWLEKQTLSPEALVNYLTFLWSPGVSTPIKEVKKLLPGYFVKLKFDNDQLHAHFEKYYDIPFSGNYKFNQEKETIDALDEQLKLAVGRQLLSDVPIGFFLSGGVDSSLLVAIARQTISKPIQCFTIKSNLDNALEGFEDDLKYALRIASKLDVKLEIVNAEVDIVRDFDKMIWHLDEPQADAAPLNVFNICNRATQMGYKVLIGGTAGDDLFSGYRRHKAVTFEKYLRYTPKFIGKMLSALPVNMRSSFYRRVKKIGNEIGQSTEQRLANYFCWLQPNISRELLNKKFQNEIVEFDPTQLLKERLLDIPLENSWLNKMLYWEMKTFLVDHNLNYTDKMGMACGVEIRVPYLDLDLVEFACSINPALKLKDGETKYILKKVAERYLPKEVVYRSKTGFGAPVRKWILEDMNDIINERLNRDKLIQQGVFNAEKVWELIVDNRAGKIDASYSIWAILAIDSWVNQFEFGRLPAGKSNYETTHTKS